MDAPGRLAEPILGFAFVLCSVKAYIAAREQGVAILAQKVGLLPDHDRLASGADKRSASILTLTGHSRRRLILSPGLSESSKADIRPDGAKALRTKRRLLVWVY